MFDNLLEIGIWAGAALLTLLLIGLFLAKLYRRASKEVSFVRTGVGGESVVMNGGALVLPVFHETMPVNMNTGSTSAPPSITTFSPPTPVRTKPTSLLARR